MLYLRPKSKSKSENISMDIDDGEAEPKNIAGNKHDIAVLGGV